MGVVDLATTITQTKEKPSVLWNTLVNLNFPPVLVTPQLIYSCATTQISGIHLLKLAYKLLAPWSEGFPERDAQEAGQWQQGSEAGARAHRRCLAAYGWPAPSSTMYSAAGALFSFFSSWFVNRITQKSMQINSPIKICWAKKSIWVRGADFSGACVSVATRTVLYKDRWAHCTVISINWKYRVCLPQLSLSTCPA